LQELEATLWSSGETVPEDGGVILPSKSPEVEALVSE